MAASLSAEKPVAAPASISTTPYHLDGGTPEARPSQRRSPMAFVQDTARHLTTKDAWFGDSNLAHLFTPRLFPWSSKRMRAIKQQVHEQADYEDRVVAGTFSKSEEGADPQDSKDAELPFYGLEDPLPIILAAICGMQHALAMLAGLITPPIILSSSLNLPPSPRSYLISASLITSGLLSALQMSRIPFTLPFGLGRRQIGSGVLSVVGTSFATLSTASAIFSNLYADGTCPMITNADGSKSRGPCPDAYGYLIGTSAVCALFEIFASFVPIRVLKRMFPPIITGVVVFLIGTSLIGESGAVNWGGGSNCHGRPTSGNYMLCPSNTGPHALPWGSPEYLGLGFLSFTTIILVEIFGSPAMRNASIVIGLIFPLVVAGPLGYMSRSSIDSAPAITFLWTTTFKLRVYGPAVLPMMAVYLALAAEAIGDITATTETSRLPVEGEEFDRRLAGGVLSDGLGGILSALFTTAPQSVFAQNNGVIAITRIANRRAGYWCAFWLVLMGILGKFSGAILAIPNSVLGGVTTFLFSSVAVSGIKILSTVRFTRRNRFLLAASLTFGLGVLLVDDLFEYLFTYSGGNKALTGFLNSITIVLGTPFLIAALVGIALGLILPYDMEDLLEDERARRAIARMNGRNVTVAPAPGTSSPTGSMSDRKEASMMA